MSSNIEEMEKMASRYAKTMNTEDIIPQEVLIHNFMDFSINQHKDHIEKIAQLETQIAELMKKEEMNDPNRNQKSN